MNPFKFDPAWVHYLALQDVEDSGIPFYTTQVWNMACFGKLAAMTDRTYHQTVMSYPGSQDDKVPPQVEQVDLFPRLNDPALWPEKRFVAWHFALTGADYAYFAAACEQEFKTHGTRHFATQVVGFGSDSKQSQALDGDDIRRARFLTYPVEDLKNLGHGEIPTCRRCLSNDGHMSGCRADICTTCFRHQDEHTSFPVCLFSRGWFRWSDGAIIPLVQPNPIEKQEICSSVIEPHVLHPREFPELSSQFFSSTLSRDDWASLVGPGARGLAQGPPKEACLKRLSDEFTFQKRLDRGVDYLKSRIVENNINHVMLAKACARHNMSPYSGALYAVDAADGPADIERRQIQAMDDLLSGRLLPPRGSGGVRSPSAQDSGSVNPLFPPLPSPMSTLSSPRRFNIMDAPVAAPAHVAPAVSAAPAALPEGFTSADDPCAPLPPPSQQEQQQQQHQHQQEQEENAPALARVDSLAASSEDGGVSLPLEEREQEEDVEMGEEEEEDDEDDDSGGVRLRGPGGQPTWATKSIQALGGCSGVGALEDSERCVVGGGVGVESGESEEEEEESGGVLLPEPDDFSDEDYVE
ncbi:hypothetical protein IWX90DRAFT_501909 [Phyllosticta citrichinensis]|uniref:Uncharacterized protein n=1 Tax=Phyllosticta citrichinensis TaxID=1130410 RepID=A0ABR1XX90_9PEZI